VAKQQDFERKRHHDIARNTPDRPILDSRCLCLGPHLVDGGTIGRTDVVRQCGRRLGSYRQSELKRAMLDSDRQCQCRKRLWLYGPVLGVRSQRSRKCPRSRRAPTSPGQALSPSVRATIKRIGAGLWPAPPFVRHRCPPGCRGSRNCDAAKTGTLHSQKCRDFAGKSRTWAGNQR
jgi:hypothetical protein